VNRPQKLFDAVVTDWTHFESRDSEAVLTATQQAVALRLKHREFLDWATAALVEHEKVAEGDAWRRFYGPAK